MFRPLRFPVRPRENRAERFCGERAHRALREHLGHLGADGLAAFERVGERVSARLARSAVRLGASCLSFLKPPRQTEAGLRRARRRPRDATSTTATGRAVATETPRALATSLLRRGATLRVASGGPGPSARSAAGDSLSGGQALAGVRDDSGVDRLVRDAGVLQSLT